MKAIVATVSVLLAVLGAADAPAAAPAPAGLSDTELIHRQQYARQELNALMTKMLQVADALAATEPDSAEAIRQAVKQAQAAFIAEDMERVMQLLAEGLLAPADQRQGRVIEQLRTMLDILRHGAIGMDERLRQIERWKRMLDRLDALIARQRSHEQASRLAGRAAPLAAELATLPQRLQTLVAAQQALLDETTAQPAAEPQSAAARLADLESQLRELAASHRTLAGVTADLPIARLPAAAKLQQDLDTRAKAAADALAAAGQDSKATDALKQARDQIAQAAAALAASDRAPAADRQQQAAADLTRAADRLSEMLGALSGKTPYGPLADRQAALRRKLQQLSADAAAATQAASGAESNLDRAGEHMAAAARQLAAQRRDPAADAQKKALAELTDDLARLAQLQRRVEQKAADPQYDKQAADQDQTRDDTQKLSDEMTGSESDRSDAPGAAAVGESAASMAQASKRLSGGQAAAANAAQKGALDQMDKARRQLSQAIAQAVEQLQAEALVKVEAMLRAVLKAQGAINAETRAVQAKRGEQGLERGEQLACRQLADRQGDQAEQVRHVVDLIEQEGTTAVFGAVAGQVARDMTHVQELLGDLRTGELTQGIQGQIVQALSDLVASLQQEIGRRKDQGGSGSGGGGGQEPLVPFVAELRLLRAMQQRVNERTAALDEMAKRAGGSQETLQSARRNQHKLLSEQQGKIAELTRTLEKKVRGSQPPTLDEGAGP